jgi:hypothetical protein
MKINSFVPFNTSLFSKNNVSNPSLYEIKANMSVPPDRGHFDNITLSPAKQLQEVPLSYSTENFQNILKNWVDNAFVQTGLSSQEFETLEIGLDNNGQFTVKGLNDDENRKLSNALNRIVGETSQLIGGIGRNKDFSTGVSRIQVWSQRMFYRNSEWAMSAENEFERDARANLIYMKNNASRYVEEYTGIALDFSQLYRTEDGKIAGYPKELAWYFESEIAKPNIYESSKITKQEGYALSIRHYASAFLDAGYDNIPDVGSFNFVYKFAKNCGKP